MVGRVCWRALVCLREADAAGTPLGALDWGAATMPGYHAIVGATFGFFGILGSNALRKVSLWRGMDLHSAVCAFPCYD